MTRKRKPDSEEQAGSSTLSSGSKANAKYSSEYLNARAGYGPARNKPELGESASEGFGVEKEDNQRSGGGGDFKRQFQRNYGYVNEPSFGRQVSSASQYEDEPESLANQDAGSFPVELVSYLKSCAASLDDDGDSMGDSIREKCLAECKGMELELCRFESSSRLVEKLFAGCREGACRWLVAFGKLKRTRQLDALCRGCSCHCLETLLFALSPRLDAEVIDELCDVIVECWSDVVISINASHFVRSFVRVLLGLPKLERVKGGASGVDVFPAEWLAKSGAQLKKNARNLTGNVHVKRTFEKVVNLALDYTSMKDLMEVDSVCLLMQEMVEYDWFANTGRVSQMVTRSLEHPEDVLMQCTAQNSSRVWQALVKRISEDERQSLYHAAFNGNLFMLSSDRFANYVVQSFIWNAKSDELVMDVFHELLDVIDQLCDRNIWSVLKGLIHCSANHFTSQKLFITQLRTHFLSTKTNKQHFVPNLFTLNNAQIQTDANGMLKFAVENGSIHGSLMLQELFRLKHNKSAVASMLSLSENTIQSLALHQGGSYVLQAFFKSAQVKHKHKDKVAAVLKKKWMELLEDPIASHVFDVLWDSGLFTMQEKRKLMTDLCYSKSQERSHSKGRKVMMWRLDARGFREDPQRWTAAEKNRMNTLAGTVI